MHFFQEVVEGRTPARWESISGRNRASRKWDSPQKTSTGGPGKKLYSNPESSGFILDQALHGFSEKNLKLINYLDVFHCFERILRFFQE